MVVLKDGPLNMTSAIWRQINEDIKMIREIQPGVITHWQYIVNNILFDIVNIVCNILLGANSILLAIWNNIALLFPELKLFNLETRI